MKKRLLLACRPARTSLLAVLLALFALEASAACRIPQWTISQAASDFYYIDKVITADLNGDRHADVVGLEWWYFKVAKGTGAGSFTMGAQVTSDLNAASFSDIAAGDFTGDGIVDVAVADYALGRVLVYPGNGTGGFLAPTVTVLPLFIHTLAADDFDGDGKLDIAYTTWEMSMVVVLAGDGAGGFREIKRTPIPTAEVVKIVSGDFDHDGFKDLALTHHTTRMVDVLYGAGDGMFSGPVQAGAGTYPDSAFELRDVDADGDADVVAANWIDQTVTVSLGLGGRAFAAPHSWSTTDVAAQSGYQDSVAVADFTGDGVLDIATISTRDLLAIVRGRGDGTFDDATYSAAADGMPPKSQMLSGDFNEDGRADLLFVSWSGSLVLATNRCGECSVSARSVYPTVSVSQAARVTATVTGSGTSPTTATGTVEFSETGTTLGTVALAAGTASTDIAGLTAGDHTITARYSGDDNYAPATAVFTQHVTTATTSVTLTFPQQPQYGQQISVQMAVTSSTGDAPTGTVTLSVDGVARYPRSLPYASDTLTISDVATHHLIATYSGDVTHPPSSAMGSFTSIKGQSAIFFDNLPAQSFAGSTLQFSVYFAFNDYAQPPTGLVQVIVDGGIVATVPPGWRYPYPAVTLSLAPGIHYLSASYPGDDHFAPGSLRPAQYATHRVIATTSGIWFEARGDEYSRIQYSWNSVPGAVRYSISRRTATSPTWTAVSNSIYYSNYGYDFQVTAGVAYLYKFEAYDTNNVLLATAFDVGMLPAFTESPVFPGTAIKAVHFSEIVSRTNLIRALGGLPPLPLPATVATGQTITAADIQRIRDSLDEGLVTLGVPAGSYTTPVLAAGDPIRAAEILTMQETTR